MELRLKVEAVADEPPWGKRERGIPESAELAETDNIMVSLRLLGYDGTHPLRIAS
jgi:hypothetical protein